MIPPIFADELPTSLVVPEQAVTIVIVLGCFLFLLNVGCAILVIVSFSKRKPTIESEFATKAELHREIRGVKESIQQSDDRTETRLNELNANNEERAKEIFRKIDDIAKSFNLGITDLHRAIGRLEGPAK